MKCKICHKKEAEGDCWRVKPSNPADTEVIELCRACYEESFKGWSTWEFIGYSKEERG